MNRQLFNKLLLASKSHLHVIVFIVCSLFFGLFSLLVTTPMLGIDESTHFMRIVELSEPTNYRTNYVQHHGPLAPIQLIDMSYVPLNQVKSFKDANRQLGADEFKQAVNWKAIKQDHFGSASGYGFLAYANYVEATQVLKHLQITPKELTIILRVVGLMSYIIIVTIALLLVKHARYGLTFAALMPSVLYLAATINADGIIIALSFLLVAIISNIFANRQASYALLAGAITAIVILSSVKVVYGLLGMLLLVMPRKFYPSKLAHVVSICLILLSAILPGVLFTSTTQTASSLASIYHSSQRNIDYDKQMVYVKSHPFEFAKAALSSGVTNLPRLVDSAFNVFGWSYVTMPYAISIMLLLAWLASPFIEDQPNAPPPGNAYGITLTGILVATFFAVELALYLSFTPVGSSTVEGVQGRYFLPLIPATILALSGQKWRGKTISRRPGLLALSGVLALSYLFACTALTYSLLNSHQLFVY